MTEFKLAEAKTLLVDFHLGFRRILRDALVGIGFADISDCKAVEELKKEITEHSFDLLLADIDNDQEDMCAAIQDIRNRRLGQNPFIVIIALTARHDREAVAEALRAGADDIIAKPVSAKALRERVVRQIENRKKFIATAGYTGPELKDPGENAPAVVLPGVVVPNSLRHVATGDETAAVDDSSIVEAMRVLSTQKFFHLSAEIGRAAGEMEKQLAAAAEKKLPEGSFERIAQWLVEINALVGEQDFKSVVDIVASTREVLDSVSTPGAEITARQLEILRLHGHAIGAVLRDSDDSAGLLVSALGKAAEVAKGAAKPG